MHVSSRISLLILVGIPEVRIFQFFDRKVSNSHVIANFYSEKMAGSNLRKMDHELIEVSLRNLLS
jgi:hypothetical protein